jgi:hypothetical protein
MLGGNTARLKYKKNSLNWLNQKVKNFKQVSKGILESFKWIRLIKAKAESMSYWFSEFRKILLKSVCPNKKVNINSIKLLKIDCVFLVKCSQTRYQTVKA